VKHPSNLAGRTVATADGAEFGANGDASKLPLVSRFAAAGAVVQPAKAIGTPKNA